MVSKLLPALLTAALVAQPAMAAAPTPSPSPRAAPQAKNPGLAAGLTAAAPPVLLLTAFGAMPVIGPFGAPIGLAAPLGLSAGYVYAGEPWRGTWVGLGGYGIFGAAIASSFVLGGGVEGQMQVFPLLMTGAALAFLGYTAWAATDVYRVTVEKNQAATSAPPQ